MSVYDKTVLIASTPSQLAAQCLHSPPLPPADPATRSRTCSNRALAAASLAALEGGVFGFPSTNQRR